MRLYSKGIIASSAPLDGRHSVHVRNNIAYWGVDAGFPTAAQAIESCHALVFVYAALRTELLIWMYRVLLLQCLVLVIKS